MRDTARTVLLGITIAATVSLLMPVGARAAGTLMTIVDPDSAAKAQVDAGKLRVGDGNGALTVNGRVDTVRAGAPTTVHLNAAAPEGFSELESGDSYTVPAGKRFVITRISGTGSVPVGQALTTVAVVVHERVIYGSGGFVAPNPHFLAADDHVESAGAITYEENLDVTVNPRRRLSLIAFRDGSSGSANVQLYLTGYLIDN